MVAQSSKHECFLKKAKPSSHLWPNIGSVISVILLSVKLLVSLPRFKVGDDRIRLHVLMEYQDHIVEKCVKEDIVGAISEKYHLPHHLLKWTKSQETMEESV